MVLLMRHYRHLAGAFAVTLRLRNCIAYVQAFHTFDFPMYVIQIRAYYVWEVLPELIAASVLAAALGIVALRCEELAPCPLASRTFSSAVDTHAAINL